MDKLKQEAIKSHYAKLVECMDPLRVMDHLAKLLSLEDMELIRKSQFISQERTRELITIILRKNEELRPFELLIKALEETDINHETMANTILNTYKHDNGATLFEKVSKTLLSDTGEMKYALQT
uniref:CARD domain-containing protein n=1 Tax=Plectus sambesii TaxID=2011161 RepID=A0A914VAB3_9BILA